ncbi:MAG: hypothetical protein LBT60_07490, partial [Oscillospiraceae bacterium]|nr:hypothetical protein [Oscillospiraceae bacterium]
MSDYPDFQSFFSDCPAEESDRAALSRVRVKHVSVDRAQRVIRVDLLDPGGVVDDTMLLRLRRQLAVHYELRHVGLATVGAPPAPRSAAAGKPAEGKLIWGRPPKGAVLPMGALSDHPGAAVVTGDVFAVNVRPARNGAGLF